MALRKAVATSDKASELKPEAQEKRHPFFISCARSLEPFLREELAEMGIAGAVPEYLGVSAPLSRSEVYRVVYGSRLASRVLRPLATFPCRDPDELFEKAFAFNWSAVSQTRANPQSDRDGFGFRHHPQPIRCFETQRRRGGFAARQARHTSRY